jgi:hypothetical protein
LSTPLGLNLQTTLEAEGLQVERFPLDGGAYVLVCDRGGRVFGPIFPGEESVHWLNPVLESREATHEFVGNGGWNVGGERFWVAPEIQFNVRDRNRFWQTLAVQPQMDPAHWTLERTGESIDLSARMMLEAYNIARGSVGVDVHRRVRSVANPLHQLDERDRLMHGVSYAGYEQEITIRAQSDDGVSCATWLLLQLSPPGTVFIPTTGAPRFADYFEPVDESVCRSTMSGLALRLSGRRRYKIGVSTVSSTGRLAFLSEPRGKEGDSFLVVRNYFNDPSSAYLEEPPALKGISGHSAFVYNDDGNGGGFGELECVGLPVGGPHPAERTETFQAWTFRGRSESLKGIAHLLVGTIVDEGWSDGDLA